MHRKDICFERLEFSISGPEFHSFMLELFRGIKACLVILEILKCTICLYFRDEMRNSEFSKSGFSSTKRREVEILNADPRGGRIWNSEF